MNKASDMYKVINDYNLYLKKNCFMSTKCKHKLGSAKKLFCLSFIFTDLGTDIHT